MFGSKAVDRFAAIVAQKTGLQQQGGRFVGQFQGYSAWSQTQMVGDHAASLRGGGGLLGGLGALMGGGTGGMVHAMTGGTFFMKHDYVIELPGWQLPGGSIRETNSFLVDKSYQQRPAIGQRVASGIPWIDGRFEVCSNDPRFPPYVCAWPELQQHLQHWPFVNLSWEPQRVWIELLDSVTRISSKFSTEAQQNGDMVLQGMSLVASAVRACQARQ